MAAESTSTRKVNQCLLSEERDGKGERVDLFEEALLQTVSRCTVHVLNTSIQEFGECIHLGICKIVLVKDRT